MKKYLILFICIFVFYTFISNDIAYSLKIPEDAIRIRIIPNSNSDFDQTMKMKVKEKLEITMFDLLKEASSSEHVILLKTI